MNPARHQKICAEIQQMHAKEIAALRAEVAGLRDYAHGERKANAILTGEIERLRAEVAGLRKALTKIDAVRNDIIGRQRIGWSSHVYPLVAALGEAGYQGLEYEAARTALAARKGTTSTTPPPSPSPLS